MKKVLYWQSEGLILKKQLFEMAGSYRAPQKLDRGIRWMLACHNRQGGMVQNMRKGHDTALKARVALEALKGEKTLAQLSSEFGVHAHQIRQWRQKLLEELTSLFPDRRKKKEMEGEELISELYRQIGQLKAEVIITPFPLFGSQPDFLFLSLPLSLPLFLRNYCH